MPEAACREKAGQGVKEMGLRARTLSRDSHKLVLHDL